MRLYAFPSGPEDHFESTGVTMDALPGVMGASQVSVAHVAPGGTLGRHAAHHRQLLAVVAGTGRVRSGDDPAVDVGPGSLVLWEEGEVFQAWATSEVCAVIVEGVGVFDLAGVVPHPVPAVG